MSDAAAHYREAVAAFGRRDMARALSAARAVLAQLPGSAPAHALAGVAALQLGDLQDAISHLREAASLDSASLDYQVQLSNALHRAGRTAEAVEAQRRAVAIAPGDARLQHDLATLLVFTGDFAGAEAAYEACLQREPAHWQAHLGLAQLRRWSADDNHVARLRALLERHRQQPGAALYLGLALAKELEDQGDYAAAFQHYASAKASHRARRPYDAARDRAMFEALRALPAGPADAGDGAGDPSDDPVFVVGMPRTGTTLVDRILSSHPQARSVGERFDFPRLLKQASGCRSPAPLDAATIAAAHSLDWAALGARYVQAVRPDGSPVRFVDKLPHNFLYLGFIARALPNARIICLRRERTDTCLANFRQLLSPDVPFCDYSFDLLDTGRYVLQFEALMEHWKQVLPGRILEVRYEDLVADQEAQTRRLLAHAGLPWDDACLAFERNDAAVATASAIQVRSPMHTGSLQRWKRYASQLAPLRAVLDAGMD